MLKSWISGMLGRAMTMVGLGPILSETRYTFGRSSLRSGFQVVPVLIGAFGVPQVIGRVMPWTGAGTLPGHDPQGRKALPQAGTDFFFRPDNVPVQELGR